MLWASSMRAVDARVLFMVAFGCEEEEHAWTASRAHADDMKHIINRTGALSQVAPLASSGTKRTTLLLLLLRSLLTSMKRKLAVPLLGCSALETVLSSP